MTSQRLVFSTSNSYIGGFIDANDDSHTAEYATSSRFLGRALIQIPLAIPNLGGFSFLDGFLKLF